MVELKFITIENYEEILKLKVAKSQETYVSTVVHSLAQAWVYGNTAYPFAIYDDDVPVGFIMLGYYELRDQYTLWKFMIDEQYQNRGIDTKVYTDPNYIGETALYLYAIIRSREIILAII